MNDFINGYVGALINVLAAIAFAKIILKSKIKRRKLALILLIVLMAYFTYILCLLKITILKSFLIFILVAVIYRIIYKLELAKSVILGFIHYLICLLADIISIIILISIFGEEAFYNNIAGNISGNIAVAIVIITSSYILRNIIKKIINTKIKYRLAILLVISLASTLGIFYSTYMYGTNSLDNLLGVLSIGITIIALYSATNQANKNNQLALEYDNLLNFIKKYEVEIDNQRIISHEAKNQLLTVKSKIIDKENEKQIIKYIDEILNDKKKVKHSEYAKFKNLPSNGLKGLFYFKVSQAQEKGIKVSVNIASSLNNTILNELETNEFNQIGKVLGVYLDNAIEASIESTDKIIGIEGYIENNNIIFIISNSYNKNRRLIGRTTKGENHGYGLILANNIINNNKRLESFNEINGNIYTEKLIIKK